VKLARSDQEDFDFLADTARAGKAQQLDYFLHLDQPIGILNYIRIANEIADRVPLGRLLDWGCGLGQMTYLLRRRGFDVTAFDVQTTWPDLPQLPLTRDLQIVRGSHPTTLPFADGAFDVVLSCGVLEHVDEYSQPGNEIVSLAELRRVLKPHGYLVIYQLPQQHSWTEAVSRTLKLGYAHPRRFTEREIRGLLERTGYRIEHLRRNNLLPKNLTGLPELIRVLYSRFAQEIIRADGAISRIPLLNRVAGVMELVARRDS
jgi:SAM-dependent methyltransferase